MFKKKNCPTSNSQKNATNAYQKGYDQAVKDYKALEPFRKYPQRIINVTNKFIKGKMHALRDYVDGYEDAKQQLVHTGYKMLENTDLKLSVFQHFFILVSY